MNQSRIDCHVKPVIGNRKAVALRIADIEGLQRDIANGKSFPRTKREATLKDVTLHTLRHTFASVAADMGYSELTIAGLLGHRSGSVTARYAHVPDRALVSAADAVSDRIMEALSGAAPCVDSRVA